MTEPDLKKRNKAMLLECSDYFAPRCAAILRDLEGHGFRPRIQQAWRSPADQLKAYKDGYTKLRWGFHNVTCPDGSANSFAADILDDDHPVNPGPKYLLMLAASAQAHGCQTGIEWGLSLARRLAIRTAIKMKLWNTALAWGWDSQHVEVVGITPKLTQAGHLPDD